MAQSNQMNLGAELFPNEIWIGRILVIVLAIALIASIFYLRQPCPAVSEPEPVQAMTESYNPPLMDCIRMSEGVNRTACFEKLVNTLSKQAPVALGDPGYDDYVQDVASLAAMTKNNQLCNALNQESQLECRDRVVFFTAHLEKSPDRCLDLPLPEQYGCFFSTIESSDPQAAASLKDQLGKITISGIAKQDSSECNMLQYAFAKRVCKDNINLDIAMRKKDASLCNSMSNESVQQACVQAIRK